MKILVVLDDDHGKLDPNSLLIRKATVLANGLGASLELLQIVYDQSLELSLFLKEQHVRAARAGLLADARERVSLLARTLQKQGLSVRHDVRWDHPRPAAIVRKIKEDSFDWVMKEAKDDRHLLGLFSNTDWELLRDSPVPVYFVKGASPPGAGVLVALEGFTSAQGSESAVLDYDVYRHGRRMAETFDTPITVVHAYQVPRGLGSYVGYSAMMADTVPPPEVLQSLSLAERKEQ